MKGFDTNQDVRAYVERLAGLGYAFGARYLRRGATWQSNLKRAEVEAMGRAGLAIVSVFQHKSNSPAEFTRTNAEIDAGAAVARAREIGQPKDSAIYVAFDTDFTTRNVHIALDYGKAFSAIVKDAGWGVGVYGDKEVLELLLETHVADFGDVADHGWATNAWGWRRARPEYIDILQTSTPFTVLPGLQIDDDEATGFVQAGMWRPQ